MPIKIQEKFSETFILSSVSVCRNMSASLENAIIEQYAKFEGYKELLEDDLEEAEPDQDLFANIRENLSEIKKQYLEVKVAQAKYKSKIVPVTCSENAFNDTNSAYKYNDLWVVAIKKEYQRVQKAASSFLKKEKSIEEAHSEPKVVVCAADEVTNLSRKIKLEIQQAETALNDTFTKLSEASEINVNQVQVYNQLKLDLTDVIDTKIPGLLKTLTQTAGLNDKDEVDKLNNLYIKFEAKQKPRLYELVHLLAEKNLSNFSIWNIKKC